MVNLKNNSFLISPFLDAANLLWRVEGGVAFAPCRLNPMTPFSTHWLEQANEGRVESVVLTSSTAWYLTSYGVS